MFKRVHSEVWIFDMEWVPDAVTGRRVYQLPDSLSDDDVIEVMYQRNGATPENPRPFLKTVLCRIVSISVLIRRVKAEGQVQLSIYSLPEKSDLEQPDEARLLQRFLHGLGHNRPQLVGFGSRGADLVILLQRALAHQLEATEFCRRPDKPWEGVDYFANATDWHIDLKEHFGAFGKGSIPSLHELASACGIPGKLDVEGSGVLDLWQAGKLADIVAYNECDTVTTYLVWLRAVHLAGFISFEQMQAEQAQLQAMLEHRMQQGAAHFAKFLETWHRYQGNTATT